MIYMIFQISCLINFFVFFFFSLQFSLFQNSHFWVFFIFGKKHPQITRGVKKTLTIINLPYYLSHFIQKNPLFDFDLFSRTFYMESP